MHDSEYEYYSLIIRITRDEERIHIRNARGEREDGFEGGEREEEEWRRTFGVVFEDS